MILSGIISTALSSSYNPCSNEHTGSFTVNANANIGLGNYKLVTSLHSSHVYLLFMTKSLYREKASALNSWWIFINQK